MSNLAVAIRYARLANRMWREAQRIGKSNPQGKKDRLREWEHYTTQKLRALGKIS